MGQEETTNNKIKELYGSNLLIIPQRRKHDFEIIQKSYPMSDPARMKLFYQEAEAKYKLYKIQKGDWKYLPFMLGVLIALVILMYFFKAI